MKFESPLHIPVMVTSERQLAGVYAVLASSAALSAALAVTEGGSGNIAAVVAERALPATAKPSATEEMPVSESPASDGSGATATKTASPSDGEIDAHGWPWSADMHASTKNQTNDGLWRMKVGVKRPDPKPGFPKPDGTGTNESGPEPDAGASATASPATPAATVEVEEDEFAAFTKANAEVEGAAAAAVPERTWADADLSSLCAQAATKLGNADPIREIIANYTPEGETPHSRNVPAENRAAFAAEIEKAAGITYAG